MKKLGKTKKIKQLITKTMIVAEIVHKHPEIVETLFRNGLFCVGCHQAASETLEQACQVHGINVNKLLKQLNKPITKKSKSKSRCVLPTPKGVGLSTFGCSEMQHPKGRGLNPFLTSKK